MVFNQVIQMDMKRIVDGKNFSIAVNISHGKLIILENTKLVIQIGEHYGLVGKNGIGKTSLLNAIANRHINVPTDLDMIYVKQEEPDTESSVLETLVSADVDLHVGKKRQLELEELLTTSDFNDNDLAEYDKLCQIIESDYIRAQNRARKILFGLGFELNQQHEPVSNFSGGWRMRISLAKALFMTPILLILDEPSNHLDLYGIIWLSSYLKTYPNTIILVSHDKYLLDEVCSVIINIDNKKLHYYRGNYELFEDQLIKDQNKKIKDYQLFKKTITAMRKKNKSKTEIEEFIKKNEITEPAKNYSVKINFLQPNTMKETYVIMENVIFSYVNCNINLENINLVIDAKTRMSIVGKNGVGKSTLLKLITGDLIPNDGNIIKSPTLRIGYYNQHFEESLPADLYPVDYLMSLNPLIDNKTAHKYLSMFGLEPVNHSTIIAKLSGGQKARVKFASFGIIRPHLLLLDEPTNHLDIITLGSLISALNNFDGAVVLVTHNIDMITSLNSDIWIIDNHKLFKYQKGYDDYVQDIYNEIDID